VLTLLLLSAAAFADVSDAVLAAMKDRPVTLTLTSGDQVSGQLVGFDAGAIVVLSADGHVTQTPRSEVRELRGGEPAAPPAVERTSDRILRFRGTVVEAADAVRATARELGGRIRKDDGETIELSWPYGINAFGIHVTVQLRSTLDGVMLTFDGHFVDAIDLGGVAKDKGTAVCDETLLRLQRLHP
jgi:hypothetical protein